MTLIEELEAYAGLLSTNSYDKAKRRAINKAIDIVKAHTNWTPASNPPEDTREVMLSLKRGDSKTVTIGSYSFKRQKYILTNKKIANDWQVVAWAEKPEPYTERK